MILMPSCSKTLSPSRCSSSASWYWNPEQPPPRTATRRPARACSSSERSVPILVAATSVRVTTTAIVVGRSSAILESMPTAEDLKRRIEDALPGATAEVEDLTGGGDHFRAEVVSDRFDGLSRIEQHRLVYDVFGAEVGGPIHALSIKTSTPGGN